MDSKLRNRILLYLVLAGVLAYGLLELSGRKPVPKISAVAPMRENLVSSINSNGKVEPVAPYVILARLDTFVKNRLPQSPVPDGLEARIRRTLGQTSTE